MSIPEVRDVSLFHHHPEVPSSSGSVTLSLLVQAGTDGRLADNFRLALTAVRLQAVEFDGSACIEHARFHHYQFRCEFQPGDLEFPLNRLSTKWENLEDLVSAGKILVIADDDSEEHGTDGQSFLELWAKHRNDARAPACSVRWMIVLDDDMNYFLTLQSLPASATR